MLRLEPVPKLWARFERIGSPSRRSERAPRSFETIRTFWIGPALPTFHRMCVQSWIDVGYGVELYAYAPVDNAPEGVQVLDAAEIMPKRALFEDAASLERKPATRANIFRMALLAQDKGPWSDPDYLMFRPLPEVRDILVGREKNGHLCNAILWAPPEFEMMRRTLASFAAKTIERWGWAAAYTAKTKRLFSARPLEHLDFSKHHWGRHAVTFFVEKHRLEDQVQPFEAFYYPVIYDDQMFRAETPFEHLVDDPKVRGLHFFYKPSKRVEAAEAGSFIDWAKKKYVR